MSTCVCVCVCVSVFLFVSASMSAETHARFLPIFVHVVYGRRSVLLRQGDEIPRGRGNFGVFFTTDNALYSMSFGTHTKTAEPIERLFEVMSREGAGYHVLDGGPDPKGNWKFFRENVAAHCKVMETLRWAVLKRLNRSRCRFGWRLGWAQGTTYYMAVQLSQGEGAIFGGCPGLRAIQKHWQSLLQRSL